MINEKFADKVLTDTQMENVAGGCATQVSLDATFFNQLGLYPHTWTPLDFIKNQDAYNKVKDEIVRLYGNYGVACACDYLFKQNAYFIGTKRVSQQEAMDFVKKQIKK